MNSSSASEKACTSAARLLLAMRCHLPDFHDTKFSLEAFPSNICPLVAAMM